MVRGHTFITLFLSHPLFRNIQFSSKHNPLMKIVNFHFIPPVNFGTFLENFNSKINIVMYSFANTYNVYYSYKWKQTGRKASRLSPIRRLSKANVPVSKLYINKFSHVDFFILIWLITSSNQISNNTEIFNRNLFLEACTDVFLYFLQNFQEHLFWRTFVNGCLLKSKHREEQHGQKLVNFFFLCFLYRRDIFLVPLKNFSQKNVS